MKKTQEYVKKIDDIYNNLNCSEILLITGEKGVGKTTILDLFLEGHHNVLRIRQLFESNYFLNPVISSLKNIGTMIDDIIQSEKNYMTPPELILREIITVCSEKMMIIVFEGVSSYQTLLLKYTLEILRTIIKNHPTLKTFFILEIDSDATLTEENADLIQQLYSLSASSECIKIKRLNQENMLLFIKQLFPNLDIHNDDLHYILRAAFGNRSWLIMILNYLKIESYLYREDGNWFCQRLPYGILDELIQKYVINRYEKLNPELKTILQKSSLLGSTFNTEILRQSFEILHADQMLSRIERISRLIIQEQYSSVIQYQFDSHESHQFIQEEIAAQERIEWNILLANYYTEKIKNFNGGDIEHSQLYYKAANCYVEIREYDKAILFYMKSITMVINLLDFIQGEKLIKRAKAFVPFLSQPIKWETELNMRLADCMDALGEYDKSVSIYSEILKSNFISDILYDKVQCKYASACYNSGDLEKAQITYQILEKKSQHLSDEILLNVYGGLATIYCFERSYSNAAEYFRKSLVLCIDKNRERDYYILLRKSSMFWDMQLTNPMMKKASLYFEQTKDIKEYSKIEHNLGADALWMGNLTEAEESLNNALSSFKKYGSNDIHYTYNCKGVLSAVFKKDYSQAIMFFKLAESCTIDMFSKMVLQINQGSCYLAQKRIHSAEECLSQADAYRNNLGERIPSYSIYYLINMGIYYLLKDEYINAISYFEKSLKLRLNNDQHYLVGHKLRQCKRKINDTKDVSYMKKLDDLCNIKAHPLYVLYEQQNICLSTLRFWE